MSSGQPRPSSVLLTQRLLWNRAFGGPSRPQPVVVLLGPVGSGKSSALKSISRACGAEVVHALFNFQPDEPAVAPPTTVETLARAAFDLSRTWKARPRAQFTRFTLGLIAVQTSLEGHSREQAKDRLRDSINALTHNRTDRVIAELDRLIDSTRSADVLTARAAEIVKSLLPPLIRTVARQLWRQAKRWHADVPEADGATPLDALISLSRAQPPEITEWLSAAFLADIRESHPRMAAPDRHSRCACPNPDKASHWHNWVFLLDNIDHPGGAEFVMDVLAARERHLRRHPGEHDALLIVATSGRWNSHWESGGWRAPWQSPLDNTGRARTVPLCREANYGHWADQASEAPRSPYYPVLLEPLTIDETAHILEINQRAPECILAQRATGGLPAAVHLLKGLLRDQQLRPGARDVLEPADPARPDANPWHKRLHDTRLAQRLPDIGIDEFITAAPFATAPWLLPHNATSLISRPNVGRILTELRAALWATATTHGGGTPNYAELHPWIARTLVSALARRDTASHHPSYTDQFEALLNDPDTLGDPARKAYCQLALGRLSQVVDAFEGSFDKGPHQDWIDRLELVARAPDDLPVNCSCGELYEDLVTKDVGATSAGRSPAGNTITRLITARWLAANPFAMPDPDLRDIIKHAYGEELPPLSRRPDVAALYGIARLATDPLL